MTQQTANSAETQTDPLYTRVISQLNEEKLAKDLTQVQLSRIKLLEEIATELPSSSRGAEIRSLLEDHLKENSSSLAARYIIGIQDLNEDRKTGIEYLGELMQEFQRAARWPIVDHIADHVLQVDENHRTALRSKVESTERLRGKKELKPYLERLASIDKNNPDIARKYGMAILEDDPDRAVEFLKMAAESYVRQRDYNSLEEIWQILVSKAYKDIPFFEKLERILAANREKTRIAAYLVGLVEPFRQEEDWENVIHILKKILQYEPNSSRARSDLVRAYRSRYENHSLLNEFLKMSDLTNNRKPVASAVANFERNIVFDTGNYVYHRTRGVGKITEIDSENVIIDFRDNPGQRMSLQMAISSLLPLEPSHIWVRYYENPDEMKNTFEEDPIEFFTILLNSYNKSITLAEIKSEIAGRFIDTAEWSKWWSRTRTRLKKDPNFGFNPRKKDELLLREKEVTLAEEQEEKFLHTSDWNQKLELAMETLKDPDTRSAAETCSHFYLEQESNKDLTKRLHSFFFLEAAHEAFPDMELSRQITPELVKAVFQEETEKTLVKLSADTPVTEFKRSIVDLVIETRPNDYQQILSKILFELPIKVHRYIIGELNRLGQVDTLKDFVEKVFRKYRDNPEIFLWVARSILSGQWTYPWIPANKEEVILMVFRLLKPLVRIESKGTRLKNQAIETIFSTTNITVDSIKAGHLPEIVADSDSGVLRRMAALFREVSYAPDAQKDNFEEYLEELRPGFRSQAASEEETKEEDQQQDLHLIPDADTILVSPKGLEERKAYLDQLINVEMPQNSKDIGEAQEKGDLRENSEYKAALERQSQLQAEIKKVDQGLKKARVIDPASVRTDIVTIGARVTVKNSEGETTEYTILSPWEADSEKNIISYISPLGKVLIGKKAGDKAQLESGAEYQIENIARGL